MAKIKNTIVKVLQKSKATTGFVILLLLVLFITMRGLLLGIHFFKIYIFYYILIISFYILNIYLNSNKYLNVIFTESNIIIKLGVPIIIFSLTNCNQILVGFFKFIFILIIRSYFSTMLGLGVVFLLLIICLCPSFVFPIISLYSSELYILRMNPENSNNLGEDRLPD